MRKMKWLTDASAFRGKISRRNGAQNRQRLLFERRGVIRGLLPRNHRIWRLLGALVRS